ncbi:hypothetical protein NMG60_11001339 [Bertholletia excelsa]
MENTNVIGNPSPSHESKRSRASANGKEDEKSTGKDIHKEYEKSTEQDIHNSAFVNHAEIAWHEGRKAWIGNRSQKAQKKHREPVMSWTENYENLLSSGAPFPQRIPLSVSCLKCGFLQKLFLFSWDPWTPFCSVVTLQEMVDFLMDIWDDESLL